jgi:hypothetical protein
MQPANTTPGPGFKESLSGLYGATKVSLGRAKARLTPEPKTEAQRVEKANESVAKRKRFNDKVAIGTYGIFDKAVVGPFGVVKAVAKGSYYAARGTTLAPAEEVAPVVAAPVEATASAPVASAAPVAVQEAPTVEAEPAPEELGILQKLGLRK